MCYNPETLQTCQTNRVYASWKNSGAAEGFMMNYMGKHEKKMENPPPTRKNPPPLQYSYVELKFMFSTTCEIFMVKTEFSAKLEHPFEFQILIWFTQRLP